MSEQELKLHVPTASRSGVERELKQAGAKRLPLHAMYFDTPERELARAHIAIRLRREGRNWVQTLKMPGANAITRLEINHPRPGPILDLSVYADTEAHGALAVLKGELSLRYETDVIRLVRKTRTRLGTVEIAYDSGVLRAGNLELPISEIEFELISGRPAAIFATARNWLPRYGLVLDSRSKSERGDALAHLAHALAQPGLPNEARAVAIGEFWGPRFAKSVQLSATMTPPQGLSTVAAECLDHVVRNAAILAEVDTLDIYRAGNAEHVHQLRVGMRRLRSAWRLFHGWTLPPSDELQSALHAHFSTFGANRDQDVLQESIIPALVKAGMPTFPIPKNETQPVPAQDTASGKEFQGWLLAMLEWTLNVQPANEVVQAQVAAASNGTARAVASAAVMPAIPLHPPRNLQQLLTCRLRKWHARVLSEGEHFTKLDIPSRHALRKRAKRLRYGLSFAESLLPAHKIKDYRRRLAAVQDVLGEMNDLSVAHDLYHQWSNAHPQAWFALGWISARQEKLVGEAQQAFTKLGVAKAFWE